MASDKPDEVSKEQRELSRRRFLRNAGVAAAAVPLYGGLADILGEQGAGAATYKRNSENAFFASHPKYHFVMVNHVTTNSFFTATIYGIQDACALTGCSYQWTGSASSIVSQMVSAFNSAIAAKANGIGCCLIDNTAFNKPVDTRVEPRHPGDRVQRRRLGGSAERPDGLRRPEQPDRGSCGRAADPQAGEEGRSRRRDHRDAGNGKHPAADRRCEAGPDQGRHQVRRGRDVGDRGCAGVQQDLRVVRRSQGREVHVRRGQRRQRRPRAVHPEEQPEGEGRRGRLGRRDAGRAGRQRRQPDLHDRPAGLPAGLRHDHAALPVQRLGRADEADEHRHGTRHRGQVDRQAVPGQEQVRGDELEAADPDAARRRSRTSLGERALGCSNAYRCPGGRPAGAAA